MGLLQVHSLDGAAMAINLSKILYFVDGGEGEPTTIYVESCNSILPFKVQEDYSTIMEAFTFTLDLEDYEEDEEEDYE